MARPRHAELAAVAGRNRGARLARRLARRLAPCIALLAVTLASGVAAAAEGVRTVASDGGAFELRWSTVPSELPFNQLFEMHVDVVFVGNEEVAGAANPVWLDVAATMPEHAHGMNTRAAVEALGDGRFVVRGLLFHMAGSWEIVFELAKGRVRDSATTRYELK